MGSGAFGILGTVALPLTLFCCAVQQKYPNPDLPHASSRCSIELAYEAADASLRTPDKCELAAEPGNFATSFRSKQALGGEISPFGKASPEGITDQQTNGVC
jgi:hypothetical protein